MTGTPWRSDDIPIALATYCENSSRIQCDFEYGIKNATDDGVCRLPNIVAIDNDSVVVSDNTDTKCFSSFSDALTLSGCSYKNVIEHPDVINHLLKLSVKRLRELKGKYSDSAGLIVAAAVGHANQLINLLLDMKQTAVLVTYREKKPLDVIRKFRHSGCDWIVSVGMISEGTNIPRLRVCCYLSHVKTELYFRQVLGRVLRVQNHKHEVGHFFMPAHPKLTAYAKRVREDIPDGIFETLRLSNSIKIDNLDPKEPDMICESNSETANDSQITTSEPFLTKQKHLGSGTKSLDYQYNFSIDSIGRFREAIFQL